MDSASCGNEGIVVGPSFGEGNMNIPLPAHELTSKIYELALGTSTSHIRNAKQNSRVLHRYYVES